MPTRYSGKICIKHPELKGERLKSNHGCIRCQNHDKRRKRKAAWKKAVFSHYGNECKRCGFSDARALTIDHEDQKGYKHKTASGRRITGWPLYKWLVRHGFPKGFRTLCCNCQSIVYRESK